MPQAADFQIERSDSGGAVAHLTGDWTAVMLGQVGQKLAQALAGVGPVTVDLSRVGRCDTSGAYDVLRAIGGEEPESRVIASAELKSLFAMVAKAIPKARAAPRGGPSARGVFERIGRGVFDIGETMVDIVIFNGHLCVTIGRAIANPRRIRWPAVFALAERAGLDAAPIIAMTTFFIGAVVALVGANSLREFGAQVFAVELIGISILREFNILITALLLAGRSASAFAAEIGSMKMQQEIDAMHVLGIDPFDALVLPRFLALLITIPLLVFVATVAGLVGGLVITTTVLDLSPTVFWQRMVDDVGLTHFWVGMSKAPVMAVIVAGIGCRQGLDVGGNVESLGRHVTSAVVQAIFAAIMIDALFAIIYMRLNI